MVWAFRRRIHGTNRRSLWLRNLTMSAILTKFAFVLVAAVCASHTGRADTIRKTAPKQRNTSQPEKRGPFLWAANTSLGFPGLITFGSELKYRRQYSLKLDLAVLPTFTVTVPIYKGISLPTKITWRYWNLGAKVFPWKGFFFYGANIGQRLLYTKSKVQVPSISTDRPGEEDTLAELHLSMNVVFIEPTVGWNWMYKNGFYISQEFGLQIAVYSRSKGYVLAGDSPIESTVTSDSDSLTSTGNKTFLKKLLPSITIIKVGWFFDAPDYLDELDSD